MNNKRYSPSGLTLASIFIEHQLCFRHFAKNFHFYRIISFERKVSCNMDPCTRSDWNSLCIYTDRIHNGSPPSQPVHTAHPCTCTHTYTLSFIKESFKTKLTSSMLEKSFMYKTSSRNIVGHKHEKKQGPQLQRLLEL